MAKDTWNRHEVDNLVSQRDAALARVASLESELAAVKAAAVKAASDADLSLTNEVAAVANKAKQEQQDALARLSSEHQEALARLSSEHQEALASVRSSSEAFWISQLEQAKLEAQQAQLTVADMQKLIDSLGGSELGRKLQRDKQRERARSLIREAAKIIAEVGESG